MRHRVFLLSRRFATSSRYSLPKKFCRRSTSFRVTRLLLRRLLLLAPPEKKVSGSWSIIYCMCGGGWRRRSGPGEALAVVFLLWRRCLPSRWPAQTTRGPHLGGGGFRWAMRSGGDDDTSFLPCPRGGGGRANGWLLRRQRRGEKRRGTTRWR